MRMAAAQLLCLRLNSSQRDDEIWPHRNTGPISKSWTGFMKYFQSYVETKHLNQGYREQSHVPFMMFLNPTLCASSSLPPLLLPPFGFHFECLIRSYFTSEAANEILLHFQTNVVGSDPFQGFSCSLLLTVGPFKPAAAVQTKPRSPKVRERSKFFLCWYSNVLSREAPDWPVWPAAVEILLRVPQGDEAELGRLSKRPKVWSPRPCSRISWMMTADFVSIWQRWCLYLSAWLRTRSPRYSARTERRAATCGLIIASITETNNRHGNKDGQQAPHSSQCTNQTGPLQDAASSYCACDDVAAEFTCQSSPALKDTV